MMLLQFLLVNAIVLLLQSSMIDSYNPLKVTPSIVAASATASTRHGNANRIASGILVSMLTLFPMTSLATEQQYKLPPIDRKDTNRCVFSNSAMGQANAARDKLYDLRECDLRGKDATGKDMSGVIAANADFSGVSFKDAQISKAYARNSKFVATDFTNAVVDRVSFDGSDMKNALFVNTVLSGTTFSNADLKDTDFSNAYLGPFDVKNLCANPTLQGTNPTTKVDTRESAGCPE